MNNRFQFLTMNTNIKHLYYFFVVCFLLIAINLLLWQVLLAPNLSAKEYQDAKLVKLVNRLIDKQVFKAGKYIGSVDEDKLRRAVPKANLRRQILQLDAMGCFIVEDGRVCLSDNALVVRNPRKNAGQPYIRRGRILDRHMEVLAETVTDEDGGEKRLYPGGEETVHVVGYASEIYGNAGVEDICHDFLIAPKASLLNDVVLSLSKRLQSVAYHALGENRGAVVVLNVRTGEIYALVSKPGFDPNQPAGKTWVIASRDKEAQPFLNRALQERYPPGSTFKVVTAAAILQREDINPAETVECRGVRYAIRERERHGTVDLKKALAQSCNSYFAEMGVRLGREDLTRTAAQFGFGRIIALTEKNYSNGNVVPLAAIPSISIPDTSRCDHKGLVAQSAIGQYEVRTTPLQMALVVAAVANDGVIMWPRIIRERRSPSSSLKFKPKQFSTALHPMVARELRKMMTVAVEEGSGRWLKRIYKIIDDGGVRYKTSYAKNLEAEKIPVAGKTGTAEVGREGEKPHSWFIGFAPANSPRIAVCVLVENAGWGSTVAAPIAIEVLAEALAEQEEHKNQRSLFVPGEKS